MRTIRTPKNADAVCAALANGKSAAAACRAAGLGRTAFYAWRNDDPEFLERTDAAIEEGTDKLEDVALQRAEDSSDLLLIFLLKARRPGKYRERYVVEGGAKPIEVVVTRRIVRPRE
ncbi:hypothetical protein [Immundisolibacter cernigliae]|uniref:Homeodomain phBC6A51-type domain-containing protein n=1 Tax=Immundisolibacter cernigliae TaxID=1810504 RepID=A0A1B1YRM1_9GAMM|nr:hypothetical protein [Immundisolibacter cernigliae]ANX03403.1 hypothetical protein PG2T_03805 [Immundisolibacter cernigliae]